jgi:hypothetical protein
MILLGVGIAALMLYGVIGLICIFGYVKNIINIANSFHTNEHGLMYILRICGIFIVPLGIVLGLFF